MRPKSPTTRSRPVGFTVAGLLGGACLSIIALTQTIPTSKAQGGNEATGTPRLTCPTDNGGITLPPGFCATVFADGIGHARHLVALPNGIVYVNTWSGRYYGNDTPNPGGFLVALQDTDGDGRVDVKIRFGPDAASGNKGGTGIAFYHGALYAETNDRICTLRLIAGNRCADSTARGHPLRTTPER